MPIKFEHEILKYDSKRVICLSPVLFSPITKGLIYFRCLEAVIPLPWSYPWCLTQIQLSLLTVNALAFLLEYPSGSTWPLIHTVACDNHGNIMTNIWAVPFPVWLFPNTFLCPSLGSPANPALHPRRMMPSAYTNPFLQIQYTLGR